MQKAEVAGAAVTFGQDVLQDQAQKCHAAERNPITQRSFARRFGNELSSTINRDIAFPNVSLPFFALTV